MSKPKHYRNICDLNINGSDVDAGSLWILVDKKLVLVDDDNYVVTDLDFLKFKEV